ncbi:MAG TPA: DUF3426 domain-containing protein [Phenylobacterium sp.]|nr:DUF3426 domain-containing protein [Phenylobacterium sp.]
MILTCPDCATSYFVDENRIPRRGRTVRCSNCGARWRATPEGEIEAEPEVEAPAPEPAPAETSVADDLEFVAAPVRTTARPAPKRAPTGLIVALLVAVVLAAAAGGAVVMRRDIAGRVPATASLFAAIGFPVDTMGLVLEGVAFKSAFEAGRPVLSVTGAIRNTRQTSVLAPPIRISLLDKAGKTLAGVVAQPLNGKVPAGSKRYFAVTLPDPPAGAQQLEVRFDLTAKVAAPPAAIAQTGPAPIEAKPIAPDASEPAPQHE